MTDEFKSKKGYYEYPAAVWDAAKCAKMVKKRLKDGCGTKNPWPGYIGSGQINGGGYGRIRYNGGIVIDGEWYQGTIRHLPIVAEGYEVIERLTWGWYIVKKK